MILAGHGYSGYHNSSGSYSSGHGPVIVTPGVATIRRTPSSKPSARRSASVGGTGPIPIRTPVIPVQIPVVPDKPGAVNGSRSGEQPEGRGGGGGSPESSTYVGGGGADLLPMASWSGQASTNPPGAPLSFQQQHFVSEAAVAGREGRGEDELAEDAADGNMLLAIRKGVKLKRTLTNDRSAPRIA